MTTKNKKKKKAERPGGNESHRDNGKPGGAPRKGHVQ